LNENGVIELRRINSLIGFVANRHQRGASPISRFRETKGEREKESGLREEVESCEARDTSTKGIRRVMLKKLESQSSSSSV
jgi:hypothetical protein